MRAAYIRDSRWGPQANSIKLQGPTEEGRSYVFTEHAGGSRMLCDNINLHMYLEISPSDILLVFSILVAGPVRPTRIWIQW